MADSIISPSDGDTSEEEEYTRIVFDFCEIEGSKVFHQNVNCISHCIQEFFNLDLREFQEVIIDWSCSDHVTIWLVIPPTSAIGITSRCVGSF